MTLRELMELINVPVLNAKVNNYIITELRTNEFGAIITKGIMPTSPIINHEEIDDEGFNSNERTNIIVDLNDVAYFNILNLALDKLQISERLRLETFRDLNHFRGLLRGSEKSIQFIIANADKLNKEECQILNLLLRYKSYFFNTFIFFEEGKDLSTYRVDGFSNMDHLDNRDDYTGLTLSRY